MIKVLYIIESLTSGGKERRLVSLMKGLLPYSNVEIKLVILTEKIHYKEVQNLGIEILFLPRNVKEDILIFSKFIKVLNDFNPTVVHCWDNIAAIHFSPICYFRRITFINSMITTAPPRLNILTKRYLSNSMSYPFSNVILTNSRAGLYSFRVPRKKGRYIYNGFNMDRVCVKKKKDDIIQELGIEKEFVVGMTASFSDMKDYRSFIEAGEMILDKRKDVVFVAVGDGPNLEREKKKVKYKTHFKFLGRQSDVESIVNIYDIGVLATYTEGISNAIMEYMALEKPVVATDGGGTNELVVDQVTGFLVSQESPAELAEKIEYLLNNKMRAAEMGKAGKERIHTDFSIHKMVEETYDLYREFSK